MNIAIVGATGNVGRKTFEVFDKKNFKFDDLYLVASEKSAGKKISFRDKEYVIENLETCLLYTSPSPRDRSLSRMPSSA